MLNLINKMIMLTSSKHLDEAIDIKNKMLDELEKTCDGCKHYETDTLFNGDTKDCFANDGSQTIVSFPPPEFGCIKFERRELHESTK